MKATQAHIDIEFMELYERFKLMTTPLIELRLNSNRLSDDEILAAIRVLKDRGIDVSRWFDVDAKHEADAKLLEEATVAYTKLYVDERDERYDRVASIVCGRPLDELSDDELSDVIREAKKPKIRKSENELVPLHSTMDVLFPMEAKKMRKQPSPQEWKRTSRNRMILNRLKQGMTAAEIAKQGFSSYVHARAVEKKWLEEQNTKK